MLLTRGLAAKTAYTRAMTPRSASVRVRRSATLGGRHVYRLDGGVERYERLPVRLRLIEVPLDGSESLHRHLGAHDGGVVEVILEVQGHVGRQHRGAGWRA